MSTGITPQQYVIRCRLRRAVKLLQYGEMGTAEIALEVGCSSQSHLTTLFGRYIGAMPGAFRKAVEGKPTAAGLSHKSILVDETKRQSAAAHDRFASDVTWGIQIARALIP
jgi:AraC-like DNA-binding protein